MYRFRTQVFRNRLGWAVPMVSGIEFDSFDMLETHYLIIHHDSGRVTGCWRMLPTLGPYMLKVTFPELLHGHAAPESECIWELSRFAIDAEGPQGFGASWITINAMRELVRFAERMGIRHFVTVTTTAIERLMRLTSISMRRFGPPIRIGIENAVALHIDIDEQTRLALSNLSSSELCKPRPL